MRTVAVALLPVLVAASPVAVAFPLVLFEDDVEEPRGWQLLEETPFPCYVSGHNGTHFGDVRRAPGEGVGGSTSLLVHANHRNLPIQNKVFGANHIGVEESHVARLAYEFSAKIDAATADGTQTAPEGSVQVTHRFGEGPDDFRTLVVGFQHIPSPLVDGPLFRWNIWVHNASRTVPVGEAADWKTVETLPLERDVWYRFRLVVDLLEARYESLSIEGPGLSVELPVAGERVAREFRFVEEATWISVDSANLWTTCGLTDRRALLPAHDARVHYDNIRLLQLGPRLAEPARVEGNP